MAYCVACGLCASMMIKEIGGLEKIGYFALFSFLMYVCLLEDVFFGKSEANLSSLRDAQPSALEKYY
ncbi:MAG: hypothetical protein ACI90V_000066 [Bacillariaceae sp.]|jgi:hypothetical protein